MHFSWNRVALYCTGVHVSRVISTTVCGLYIFFVLASSFDLSVRFKTACIRREKIKHLTSSAYAAIHTVCAQIP